MSVMTAKLHNAICCARGIICCVRGAFATASDHGLVGEQLYEGPLDAPLP